MTVVPEPQTTPAGLPDTGPRAETESVGTVLLALLANLVIAVAKLIAGLLSGSAAMLSEAAHSVADTVTEVFLYVALRRGRKPADEEHPFGYGKESYVWAFIAALFTFVGGAGFSIYHGVTTILSGAGAGEYLVSYLVLAVSFAAEGASFLKARRQVRDQSRRWNVTPQRFLRLTPDTTVKAVFFEDSAALIGLLLAAAGLGLAQLTGQELWDGLASILIGGLLLVVASVLARSNVSLLVGRAVPRRIHNQIAADLRAIPVVTAVPTLLTMQIGPGDILVAAKVDFDDTVPGKEIEAASDEAERRLRDRFPEIRYVFLDPTRGEPGRDHIDGGLDR
ncbi:cation diffusion facilitator family transporter [Actinoplanes octamycinicus]|uniref:Cation diffusion facilitator family transporter n=1 Tax=Actinoplanes octamycinicus TaxID=135948 RepID=A0A7W7MBV5_9ACTN|nr:cation diffusion facilitator family transporter [Actinoplanes octamycinicus]MBB4744467.1 cation diffusion facilitator family transporter [Actinoplanes octamycinicus]GIE61616.1 cation diffusion facilitator transporter [Actinoplanes octamycinicus]